MLYRGLAVDAANQRALVAGFSATDGWLGLYGVDLTSGDAEPLSNEEIPDDVNSWSSITGVAMGGGFAWVTDTRHLTVTRVDLATGARTASVHGRTNHDLATRFLAPDGLALDPASRRAWVVTECFGCANGVYEVSLETGERRLHASFQQPSAVAVDLQNGRILVTTTYPEATLWTVQLDSASVPLADVLSGPAIPNDHPPLVGYASDILLDPAAGRALVRDDDAVVAVSLVDGTRTAAFDDPGGCVTVDPQGRRVFSTAGNKLVSISLDDLAEDVVIDSSGASSPLNSPEAISYDVQSHRVYVLDTGDIIGIDASFGTHVPITSLDDPGTGTRWVSPTAVALDPVTQTLFVTDQLMGALYAVDAITGHRVIFTR